MIKLRYLVLFCFCLSFCLAGCSGPPLESIRGTVVFEGKPIKVGSVTFLPQSGESQQTQVLPTVADIRDGKFELPQSMGIAMQKYKVVVVGYDGVPVEFSPDGTKIFNEYKFEHVFKSARDPLDIVVPNSLQIKLAP